MRSMAYQYRSPKGSLIDRGVHYTSAGLLLPLRRTGTNVPTSGQYYCNEKVGVYIFSRADWLQGLTVNYIDHKKTGPGACCIVTVGGPHD